MNEQATNQRRVTAAIEKHVLDYLRARNVGERFHMSYLTAYVTTVTGGYVAPDSPGRILRQLRKSGRVSVAMVDRAKSTYELTKAVD